MTTLIRAVILVFLLLFWTTPHVGGTEQFGDPCDRCHLQLSKNSLKPVHDAPLCLECHGLNLISSEIDYDPNLIKTTSVTDLCLSCHGKNGDTSSPLEHPPASGDFYYVADQANYGDNYGHNVEIYNPDQTHGNKPPGGAPLHEQLRCTDCHDPHLEKRYRNLGYRITDGANVKGVEHDQWEMYNTSPKSHNVYNSGMSDFCLKCHDDFGKSKGFGGCTIQHPANFPIVGNIPRSALYGKAGNPYDPVTTGVPVEDADASDAKTQTIRASSMVSCLSCHRAHASKYAYSTRWDTSEATKHDKGCNVCHGL